MCNTLIRSWLYSYVCTSHLPRLWYLHIAPPPVCVSLSPCDAMSSELISSRLMSRVLLILSKIITNYAISRWALHYFIFPWHIHWYFGPTRPSMVTVIRLSVFSHNSRIWLIAKWSNYRFDFSFLPPTNAGINCWTVVEMRIDNWEENVCFFMEKTASSYWYSLIEFWQPSMPWNRVNARFRRLLT